MSDMDHMNFIERVATADVAELRRKETTYRGSWKRRGGVGAFMMLARKIDRLEEMMANPVARRELPLERPDADMPAYGQYNVFEAVEAAPGGQDGTVLAEIRDLRRYLLLVEAEMCARGVVAVEAETPRSVQKDEEETVRIDDHVLVTVKLAEAPEEVKKQIRDGRCGAFLAEPAIPMFETGPGGGPLRRITPAPKIPEWAVRQLLHGRLSETCDEHYVLSLFPQKSGQFVLISGENRYVTDYDEVVAVLRAHPRAAAPVPAEDSNRHAERANRDAMLCVGDRWVNHLEAATFLENQRYFSDEVRGRYVRVGDWFVLDRRQFPAEERAERFIPLPMTATRRSYESGAAWARGMYEPRPGVDGEWQLREEYRDAWGPQ